MRRQETNIEEVELSAHPSSPAAGYSTLYPKTDGEWYVKKSDGTTSQVTNQSGGSGVSESLAIAYAVALG